MASDWIGREGEWKRHSRPLAQAALRKAQSLGFFFRASSGKPFGRLRCPSTNPEETCLESIFSTSKTEDGSATAQVIEKLIKRCPHLVDAGRAAEVDEWTCDDLDLAVYRCERLLEAVEELLESAEYERRFEEHFIAAEATGDPREFSEAEAMDDLARELSGRALGHTATAGESVDPWPPSEGAAELLATVGDHLAAIPTDQGLVCDRALDERLERVRGQRVKLLGLTAGE